MPPPGRASRANPSLADLDGFRGLPAAAASAMTSRARVRRFAAGETLFREGDESHGIFVLLEGEVRVVRVSRGRQHVLHTEHRGGTLGEVPFFDRQPYPATAIAWTIVEAVYLDRVAIADAMRASPDVALFFLGRLAKRLRGFVDRLDSLATADVRARLSAYLLEQAALSRDSIVVVTQQALAEELGTVREVVMRALRGLREERIVRTVGRGRIEILDARALRRLASRE